MLKESVFDLRSKITGLDQFAFGSQDLYSFDYFISPKKRSELNKVVQLFSCSVLLFLLVCFVTKLPGEEEKKCS